MTWQKCLTLGLSGVSRGYIPDFLRHERLH